jgi:hypothetical protein
MSAEFATACLKEHKPNMCMNVDRSVLSFYGEMHVEKYSSSFAHKHHAFISSFV